jgi:hypothetical protein
MKWHRAVILAGKMNTQRERVTMLRYTYISYLVTYKFLFLARRCDKKKESPYPWCYSNPDPPLRRVTTQLNYYLEVIRSQIFEALHKFVNLMYVCPCIIYENDEGYQLDAQIYLLS